MRKKQDAQRPNFLLEWLKVHETSKLEFAKSVASLSSQQLERIAEANGFRTWQRYREYLEHRGLVLRLFVAEDAFSKLWELLSAYDIQHETFSLSDAYGGVPATLLRQLNPWYRTPKFTPSQLTAHYKKIASTCDDLILLLQQVSPGHEWTDRFDAFRNLEPSQARYVLRSFKSPPGLGKRKRLNGDDDQNYTKNFVQQVLKQSQITPIEAIRYIKFEAEKEPYSTKLPTKLSAKNAMRTYFITATFKSINCTSSTIFHEGSIVSSQLLADLVSLIADTDCTADDVRKALKIDRKIAGP